MSEYTTAIVRPVRVTLAQRVLAGSRTAAIVRRRFPDLQAMPSAMDLIAAADELRAASSSLENAAPVGVSRPIALVAAALAGVDVAEITDGTRAASLIEAAAGKVAADDRSALTLAVVETLRDDLGFHVTTVQNRGATRLEALQASRVVAVDIADFGRLRWDIAGCEAGSCRPLQRQIIEGLRKRGVELQILDRDHHQDPKGGAMLRNTSKTRRRPQVPEPLRARQTGYPS